MKHNTSLRSPGTFPQRQTFTYSALQKYWNSKVKIALLAVESRYIQIWFKYEYETKLQNVTFYYWVIQLIDVLPAKKFRISYSHYFCILNLAFEDDTHKPGWRWGSWFVRKVSNLDAKRRSKSNRAIAKTKGMEKSRVWKPPATNYLIGWENHSSWSQTNHKSCENEP